MPQPTLADLKAFMAVAEHLSFRRAADMLGITRSALSHSVRSLEERLGARLLHRTTRSVALTEAGERLLARLVPLLGDLDTLLGDIAGQDGQPVGRLRINGSEGAIRQVLLTYVPVFLARYPGIELDLVAEGRLVDIVEQGFDAGLRLGEAVPADMVAIALGPPMRFVAVAAPAYLAAHPAPEHPQGLAAHRCIRQRLPSGKRYRWDFSQDGQELAIEVPGALTLDNNHLMVEAAQAGLGIAYVPEPYACRGLESGQLRRVLEAWCPPIAGIHLYYPGNRQVPATLRVFIDLIKAMRE